MVPALLHTAATRPELGRPGRRGGDARRRPVLAGPRRRRGAHRAPVTWPAATSCTWRTTSSSCTCPGRPPPSARGSRTSRPWPSRTRGPRGSSATTTTRGSPPATTTVPAPDRPGRAPRPCCSPRCAAHRSSTRATSWACRTPSSRRSRSSTSTDGTPSVLRSPGARRRSPARAPASPPGRRGCRWSGTPSSSASSGRPPIPDRRCPWSAGSASCAPRRRPCRRGARPCWTRGRTCSPGCGPAGPSGCSRRWTSAVPLSSITLQPGEGVLLRLLDRAEDG